MSETKKCPVCGKEVEESEMVHELTVVHQWSLRRAVKYGPLGGGEGKVREKGIVYVTDLTKGCLRQAVLDIVDPKPR